MIYKRKNLTCKGVGEKWQKCVTYYYDGPLVKKQYLKLNMSKSEIHTLQTTVRINFSRLHQPWPGLPLDGGPRREHRVRHEVVAIWFDLHADGQHDHLPQQRSEERFKIGFIITTEAIHFFSIQLNTKKLHLRLKRNIFEKKTN